MKLRTLRNLILPACLCLSLAAQGQIVINEVSAANGDQQYDPTFYNFGSWVELYNTSKSDVNISSWFISDDPSQPQRWRLPPESIVPGHGYLLVWCDGESSGIHTNFSLSPDGEWVVLTNNLGERMDQMQFPSHPVNASFGRISDGGLSIGFLAEATPLAANPTSAAGPAIDKVTFSQPSGRYNSLLSITLSSNESAATIHYTVDGSEPTSHSTTYTSPVPVNSTTVVKAKAYVPGRLPSKTAIATYFIAEHTFTIPVVSISTNPDYLWNTRIGIYVDGTNGVPGNCQGDPKNFNQPWDRHAFFEYYLPSGERRIGQAIDLRIGGACSRGFPQKSLVVRARKKYGKNTLGEPFFQSKDIRQYGSLMLRNSGNDFNNTSMRDALMQVIPVGEMDIDYMAYQPSVLYLNGQYWGIQSLREKIDGDFIEANYGVPKEDIDLIESWGNPIEGTTESWYAYLDGLRSMNLTNSTSFGYIDSHIDVQEYINYLVSEIYYANWDWPGNNVKFWRQRSTNGKFRWILWDTDFGFDIFAQGYATHPTLNFATDPASGVDWPNPPWSTEHIRLVLQNPVFRNRFIQTFNTALQTVFKPERVIRKIDSLASQIAAEMPYHKARWGGSNQDWLNEIQRLRDFATQRNVFMQQHLHDFFSLGSTVAVTTQVPDHHGSILLNGAKVTNGTVSGVAGGTVQAEAVPKPGYQFAGWEVSQQKFVAFTPIAAGASWKYFDGGQLPAADWFTTSFDDTSWNSGAAELGYGDGDEKTVVNFGPDANNKFPTTYFRYSFDVSDTTGFIDLTANLRYDDGAAVYLNGTEVFRENLPAGTLDYSTYALTTVSDETAWHSFNIPKGLLVPGNNTIAIEIHQVNGSSSDISMDFSLQGGSLSDLQQYTFDGSLFSDTLTSDLQLIAHFTAVKPVSGLYINEVSANPSTELDEQGEAEDWIELVNLGADTVSLDGLYMTDNLSAPYKHRFRATHGQSLRIPPGGFHLLWADEGVTYGPSHVRFKLSADGEEVGLFQVVGDLTTQLDGVTFGAQPIASSFSRIPDGTGPWELTALMTPRASNALQVVTGLEPTRIPDSPEAFPNPTTGEISIYAGEPIGSFQLTDMLGHSLLTGDNAQDTTLHLSLSNLSDGLFVVHLDCGGKHHAVRVLLRR
ncbi:MAG: CotH kinase family protein [Cyclobacteriaceae bacterium]|nr:CotH kinase family protein [Cyclobacteriaceae bacterium]